MNFWRWYLDINKHTYTQKRVKIRNFCCCSRCVFSVKGRKLTYDLNEKKSHWTEELRSSFFHSLNFIHTKEYYALKLYAWYNTINFANWDAISEIARNIHVKVEWNAKHPVEAQFTLFGTIAATTTHRRNAYISSLSFSHSLRNVHV